MSILIEAVKRLFGRRNRHKMKISPNNVVLITGCDSGLGFSFAMFCHSMNMTVISACHNINSDGARLLKNLPDPKRLITIELDLLKTDTIENVRKQVVQMLQQNPEYEFTALVNNAGVMCFGEFEWQTCSQFEMQINVNVLGTMRLTKEFLPLLRQQHARIINITSHCALQPLPTLSAYAASKAAIRFWNDALRVEMQQYGVKVINFIPGSFIMESNITSRQQQHANEMWTQFSDEQRIFYGNYFRCYNDYLNLFVGTRPPNLVHDTKLLGKFKSALTDSAPKSMYIHEPWRYKFYRFLFKLCPTAVTDWLVVKFCAMPTYNLKTVRLG